MTQDLRLGVEVTDSGSTKRTEKAIDDLQEKIASTKDLTKQLQKELKALAEANTAGTAGSRKMADMAGNIQQYGTQRGVAGLTGASARDFANQAQGLDGLVRLYATYAANVFALGAAFRALSDSMDTDNMIKGLDQLGAAVGRNLGGLSKRVAELSGGAISMREAMQAVAQTSSGGMSTKNIERLAKVASSASVALGVSMPDAINRLSRGITKLEPELLDELGIMTRLEPATQAYARELGKAASQLTDFERRQAFANAVLLEGETKFGAISDIATNPYDKLLASLKNVLQIGSSVVNTVLGPIADLLASSPAALTAGIGALMAMILKQAVPAIGQIKQGLSAAAEAAAEVAKKRSEDAVASGERINSMILDQVREASAKELEVTAATQKKIEELRGKSLRETSLAYKVLNNSSDDVTASELKGLEARAKRLDSRGLKAEAASYREIVRAIQEQKNATVELDKVRTASLAAFEKEAKGSKTSVFGITQALAIEAQTVAVRKGIISNAAYNASLVGMKGAFTILNSEIEKSGLTLTRFQTIMLKVQATGAILSGVIATLGSAFLRLTNAVAVIGTIIAVITTLDYFLSSNAKEAAEFSSALDEVTESSKNLHRTLDQLNKQMTHNTIEGINAMAQALDNLNNSTSRAIATAKKNKDALTGIWSVIGNEVSKIWSGDVESKLAASLTQAVSDVLDLVEHSGLKDEARERFKSILGIDNLDTSSIKKGIADLSKTGLVDLEKFTSELTRSMNNSASRLTSFKVATDASTRAYQQFIQTTSNTSPLFRVGAALQNVGVAMFDISKEAKLGVQEVEAVITHISNLPDIGSVFGKEFIHQLVDVREEFVKQGKSILTYKNLILDLDKQIAKHSMTLPRNYDVEKDPALLAQNGFKPQVDAINLLRKLVQEKKAIEEGILTLENSQSEKARKLFIQGLDTAFTKGTELVRVSFGQAMEKAALAIGKASLLGLSGENRAAAENALAKQELEIQLRAIDTNIDLILSQELLKAALDEATATTALLAAQQAGKTPAELKMLEEAKSAANIFSKILNSSKVPNFANASALTDNENVAMQVRARGMGVSQRMAEQNEGKILVQGQMQAQGIAGSINIRNGRLEDTQKMLNLESQLVQATQARAAAVAQIVTIANEQNVLQQVQLERQTLMVKQEGELAAINTAILNATSAAEAKKQEDFKLLIQARQEQELSTQAISGANRLINARIETLGRQVELTKALNEMEFVAGFNRLEVLNAENLAYSQLFGIVENYAAAQNFIVGTQKVQLDFVKAISNAQLDFMLKEVKAKEQLAALDPVKDSKQISIISEELSRQERLTKSLIANAKSNLTAQQKILEVNKKSAIQQATYNRLLNNSTEIANSLSTAFGDVGDAIGGVVDAFGKLIVNTDKGVKAIELLVVKQEELKASGQSTTEIEDAIALQRQKNTQQQLLGYASMTGAAKNMFEEQSTGYRTLAAIEKAIYIVHIAMTLKQMATDAIATVTSIANSEARTAASVAEAEVAGTTSILKALASLPFPASLAAAAVTAAVVAGLLAAIGGKGGKIPATPGGVSAEDMQATQGTGRKYIDGKLTDTNFGALGSPTDKVKDIANSIELIKDNSSITANYGQETLVALQAIEENTKQLAASAFKNTNIGKLTSGFGTEEGTKKSKGFTIMSPTTKREVEIIDKGIQVFGSFNEILKGTADFLEFETVKTTKTKSAMMGLMKKTKIKISTNTKDLPQDSEELIVNLFSNLANTAVKASREILGQADTKVQNILDNFVVSFKTSGMGLSGEDFAEAILAESSTIMNEIIAKAMPEIDQFRELGEGFTGTLVRLATTMGVVNDKVSAFGFDMDSILPKVGKIGADTATAMDTALTAYNNALSAAINTTNTIKVGKDTVKQPTIDETNRLSEAEMNLAATRNKVISDIGSFISPFVNAVNDAQNAFTSANLAVLQSTNAQTKFATVNKLVTGELKISENTRANASAGITDDVRSLYEATIRLNDATSMAVKNLDNQSLMNITFYDALVKQLGGLEAFTQKTDFFFTNFYSEAEQLESKTRDVVGALQGFVQQGFLTQQQVDSLTDSTGNTREEYRQMLFAQNVLTESGRAAINAMLTLAPAIVDVTDEFVSSTHTVKKSIKQVLDDIDLNLSTFGDILDDAVLGKLNGDEIGESIAITIKEGFYRAMSASFVDQVTNSIVTGLISPILSGALNLSAVGYTAVSGLIDGAVTDIVNKANTLASILDNPLFKQAMTVVSTAISQVVTKVNANAKSIDSTFSSSKIKDYLQELKDLGADIASNNLDDIITAEQTRLDLLQEQADALKDSSERFKDFSKSLADFKQSLLTGPLSPLTPLQQYSTIKTELDNLFQTASTSTNIEDKSAALSKIQEISSSFLDISRLVYASGTQYTNDFTYVQTILDSLINTTGTQATIDEQQLSALNAQISTSKSILESLHAQQDALDNINNNAASIADRILELTNLLKAEYKKGTTNITEGFSVLDRNFDNVLTIDELKASGMASDETLLEMLGIMDTNGDKQISRLEALKSASTGTLYTLQSITPILEGINSGIIDFNTGLAKIAVINQANAAVGGAPISGNYSPAGGTGVGFVGSNVAYRSSLGGYIQNGTVYGVGGQSVSLSTAKSTIFDMVNKVNNNTGSAKDLYNLFMQWGVNSSMVSQILGVTKQEVLDWFRYKDPSIPAFAQGINNVPDDMLAFLHQGERVLPKADNEQLMQSLSNRNDTNEQLIVEIRQLNQKIAKLEKAVVDGAVLNAISTDRNTEEISKAVKDSSSTTRHNESIKRKVGLM